MDNIIVIKQMYILGKFESVKGKISLEAAIEKIIQCNKLAYDGYENKRQCIELVYHGILVKADTGRLLSLNDYIYNKNKFENVNGNHNLVWDGASLSKIDEKNGTPCISPPGDCVIPIRDSHVNEILCMLTNWS